MKPAEMRYPAAAITASRSGIAQWCSSNVSRCGRTVRDPLEHIPYILVGESVDPVGGGAETGLERFLAVDAQPGAPIW